MKLIVGGSYAGKTEYVKGYFGLGAEDILDIRDIFSIQDHRNVRGAQDVRGDLDSLEISDAPGVLVTDAEGLIWQMTGKKCLLHLEEWVRALVAAKREPLEEVKKLLEACPDGIFVMDEIGNGIVPMEREERIWRDAVGQAGCFLAARAEEVVRVVCGLPMRIKA